MYLNIIQWALTLIVINTLVLSFATIFPVFASPHPKTKWSQLFYVSGHLSQMFIFSLMLGLLFALTGLLIKNPTIFIPINSFFNMVLLFFLIANSVTYLKYRFNINKTIIDLVFSRGSREVVQPSQKEIFIFITGIIIAFLICSTMQSIVWIWAEQYFAKTLVYAALAFLLACYLINQMVYGICAYLGYMPVLQYTVKIFAYDATSLYRLIQKLGLSLTNPRNRMIHLLRESQNKRRPIKYPLNPIKSKANTKPINVLMIIIDSWRFDMLNQEVSPHIYQFSQDAHIFKNHWSSGNTTQPGLFGLFYGIPTTYWSAIKKQKMPSLLVKTLQDHDYEMGVFTSANLLNPPFHKTIFSSIDNLKVRTPGKTPLERDKNMTKSMLQFLNNRDKNKPFYGFLFYDSAHGYYAIPELPKRFTPTMEMNHITTNNSTDPKPIFNLYKNAVYAIDECVKEIFQALEKENLMDNTLVLITADHGQEFNDYKKNYWEHPSNFGQYQVKVPLIIKYPSREPKIFEHQTTHYDITPTLLQELVNVRNPASDYSIGYSLYKKEDRLPFVVVNNYTNAGIICQNHITNIQRDGHYQITDTEMNQLELAKPNIEYIKKTIELFNRYYQ